MQYTEYVMGMLKNTKENTYHEIVYRPSVMSTSNLVRFKSLGHRTEGINDLEECRKLMMEVVRRLEVPCWDNTNVIMLWDGEDMPVDKICFTMEDYKSMRDLREVNK